MAAVLRDPDRMTAESAVVTPWTAAVTGVLAGRGLLERTLRECTLLTAITRGDPRSRPSSPPPPTGASAPRPGR
ncbi:hypothetical protein [Streptomyces sp. NPDC002990]